MKNGRGDGEWEEQQPECAQSKLIEQQFEQLLLRRRREFPQKTKERNLLSDRADSLIHGPRIRIEISVYPWKELEGKRKAEARSCFEKVSDAER